VTYKSLRILNITNLQVTINQKHAKSGKTGNVVLNSCLRTSVIYATADEAVAYMFYKCFFCFFLFFSVHQNYETTVLGNGWTDFHETFTKRYRETWSLKRRAAAWRMANVDDLRNLRYDSGAITRGRHARRLRLQMHERANGFNLVFFIQTRLQMFIFS